MSAVRTGAVLVTLGALAVGGAAVVTGGDDGYLVRAQFSDAAGLRKGFTVRIDGAPVGKIAKLTLDDADLAVADLRIDEGAAPVGADARAVARAADLLGEKFVDLQPGNRSRPVPSGSVIPPRRTALAIELDDVVNAVDLPTRQALRVFVNEQGQALVGRGNDLGAMLAALPRSLDRTGTLLRELASDNEALGRLVEESDRVVGSVARERASLGRLVASFGGTLDILGRRRSDLGATIRKAPAALASARGALTALEAAAAPLGPAARGLQATAPRFTRVLAELPAFARDARPTLRTLRSVAPSLERLGGKGAPTVARLRGLSQELRTFATAFDPVTDVFDNGMADFLGVLEGWARATQARDTASHVFRFGFTAGLPSTAELLKLLSGPEKKGRRPRKQPARPDRPSAGRPTLPKLPAAPKLQLPKVPDVSRLLPELKDDLPGKAQELLDFLLGS